MASYHLSVKSVRRSEGRSATAAAAYRHAERIECHREGRVHDYRAKQGVEASLLVLPEHAPAWAEDRQALWNAAEARETRVNSVTAREWELALPHELDAAGRRALVEGFARELVSRYGVAADVAIHAPHREGDQRNWHAHVLTTTRALTQDGLTDKTRVLDAKQTGGPEVEHMRALWGEMQNHALERLGHEERVDHRTLAVQRDEARALGHEAEADNLNRAPEVKLGPVVSAVERREQRHAEADGHEYVPLTERGAQVHEARQARSLLQELAEVRERLREAVQAQVQDLHERAERAHEAYAHAREEGAHTIRAGLAALRAAAQRQGIEHGQGHERGLVHGQAAGHGPGCDRWQERQATRASIKERLGRILARDVPHHAQDGPAVGLSAHGLDRQHGQGQEQSLGPEAIRERLEALRDRVRPVAQHEELGADLPAHGQERQREHERRQEAHQAQAQRLDAIHERLRGVLDRAKPVALEHEGLSHEHGPEHGREHGREHGHKGQRHAEQAHDGRAHGDEQEDPLALLVKRLREGEADAPSFASQRQARAFRAEMERRFDRATLQRLCQGHEATLMQITDDRLDGLCLARAWLDSQGEHPRSEARMSLVYAIAGAQIDAKRERLAHEEDGHGWGL